MDEAAVETIAMETDVVRAILENKEDFLRRHLILSKTVIRCLREHDVIGEFVAKQILGNHNNPHRQITLLLTSLKTRGISALNGFLDVLRKTFHGWLADDILGSQVEIPIYHEKRVNVINVRDVISRYTTSVSMTNNDGQTTKENDKKQENDGHIKYVIPDLIPGARVNDNKQFLNQSQEPTDVKKPNKEDNEQRTSPITQIPGSLRDLQRIFDSESSSTRKSLAVLKQEELTIKALLQQNLREQQELSTRQEALSDIKCQMRQMNDTATQLYRPEPEVSHSKSRLRHLQRTFWSPQ